MATPAYTLLQITHSHQDRVATVQIMRPEVRNALNATLIAELTAAFTELAIDERLHAIILSGAGPIFCAGADIAMMRESIHYTEEENYQDALRLADMLLTINTISCPVIGRVQGHALGGGAGLVAVCDIAIASENAQFAFSEVKLGIVPAVISPYILRKIGETHTRALFTTGKRFSASHALSIGLVHIVVSQETLDQAVEQTVKELLSSGPQAIRSSKRLIRQISTLSDEQARQQCARMNAQVRVSAEGQEGLSAFLEKRTPNWRR